MFTTLQALAPRVGSGLDKLSRQNPTTASNMILDTSHNTQ